MREIISRLADLLDRQIQLIEQLDACEADSTLATEIYIALGECLDILIEAEKNGSSGS